MLRKILFSITMLICLLLQLILSGDVSAAVAPLPGCSDSTGYTLVDLSSAVNKTPQYDGNNYGNIVIAAATKWVDRAGNETDTGIWYFKARMSGKSMIKKNTDLDYVEYNTPGSYYICIDLIQAANENVGKKTDNWPESYLNGDLNYPYITTGGGGSFYLDASSVKVIEYNPPIIQMTGSMLFVSRGLYDSGTVRRSTLNYKYNIDLHKVWDTEKDGKMHEVPSYGDSYADRRSRMIVSAIFRCLYGMPFYRNF